MHITPLAYGLIGLICLGACAGFLRPVTKA